MTDLETLQEAAKAAGAQLSTGFDPYNDAADALQLAQMFRINIVELSIQQLCKSAEETRRAIVREALKRLHNMRIEALDT